MRRGEGGLTMPDVRVPRSFPLYVPRHGETEWNVAQRMQGGLDLPLTARGRVQAAEMARLLAAELTTGRRSMPAPSLGRRRQPGLSPRAGPRRGWTNGCAS